MNTDAETGRSSKGDKPTPAAGPHAREELTNPDLTPGTGALPAVGDDESNVQPTS